MTTLDRYVVVKIGGSLLTKPNLAQRLELWLSEQSRTCRFIFVVGGGPTVEGLREIDKANQIENQISHWAAISLMDTNAQLLKSWLPQWPIIDDYNQLKQSDHSRIIFSVEKFLLSHEPNLPSKPLPMGWQTTSDAIAARIAECMKADLVLLKSREVAEPYNWGLLAEQQIVDPVFATMANNLRVRIETLPKADQGIGSFG